LTRLRTPPLRKQTLLNLVVLQFCQSDRDAICGKILNTRTCSYIVTICNQVFTSELYSGNSKKEGEEVEDYLTLQFYSSQLSPVVKVVETFKELLQESRFCSMCVGIQSAQCMILVLCFDSQHSVWF
jgi:hypothetical protein